MNAIVFSRVELDEISYVGEAMVKSGFFSDAEKVAQASVKIIAGRAIGLDPVSSMRSFHVIDGKIEPTSELLAAMVKAHPRYDYRVRTLTNEACAIEFFDGDESLGIATFDQDDVSRAGLGERAGSSWSKYPRSMLFARALSQGVGFFCPDVIYTQAPEPPQPAAGTASEGSPDTGAGGPTTLPGEETVAATPAAAALMPGSAIAYGEGAASDSAAVGEATDDVPAEPTAADGHSAEVVPPDVSVEEDAPGDDSSTSPELAEPLSAPLGASSEPDLRPALWEELDALTGSRQKSINAVNRANGLQVTRKLVDVVSVDELEAAISQAFEVPKETLPA